MAGWSWDNPPSGGGSSGGGWSWQKPPSSNGGGGGGGLFGWIGSKLSLAGRDIEGIPGGLLHLGETLGKPLYDSGNAIIHGRTLTNKEMGDVTAANKVPGAVATGMYDSLRHPLRDPFQTALTVAPAVGTVGRFGEAGIALKGAEGASVGERLAAAGKAFAAYGGQPYRTLTVGEGEARGPVTLLGSRNAGVRLMQRGYDRMMQAALDREASGTFAPGRIRGQATARMAAHATKRAYGAMREEERIAERMGAVPAALLDKSALRLAKIPAQRRLQQAALELTSQQVPAEEAAAYHYAQAASENPAENLAAARLYEQVAKHNMVHVDDTRPAGQRVFVNPAYEKLAKADTQLARVQKVGDKNLAEKGVMAPSELQARVDAPARIRAGAHYEEPTPGKLGIASPTLAAARGELQRVSALHERALAQDAKWLHDTKNRDLGALSPADAQARLAELDKVYERIVQRTIPHVSPYGGKLSKTEQLDRNFLNSRAGIGKYRGMSPKATVKQEEWNLADAKIRDLAEKGATPEARHMAELIRERDALRRSLDERSFALLGGEHPSSLPSAPASAHASVRMPSNPHTNRINYLGNHLEKVQARVAKLEAAAAKREKPTGIVGGEHARPGRGYTGEAYSEKKLLRTEHASTRQKVGGIAQEPITKKPYTGRNIELGLRPKDITGAASRHYRLIQRYVNTDRLRRGLIDTGSSSFRRSKRDVLLAVPGEDQAAISTAFREILGQASRAVDQPGDLAKHVADLENEARAEGLRAGLQERVQGWLNKVETSKNDAIGAPAPDGYRWVDEHAVQRLQDEAQTRGGAGAKVGRVMDDVNSSVTAATVYFKVGHAGTREFTNAATNIMQGSANPLEFKQSFELWGKLSEEDQARMFAAAGQHGFASLPHESGRWIGRFAGKGAQWWARRSDAPFRFNALAYEFRKAGYKTPEQVRAALDALENRGHGLPAHEWAKISAAARRADREAISYDRLNPFEKRFLTRLAWFYPWLKGSTTFTVRSILEHPVKMSVAGEVGAQGRQIQEKQLGPTPSFEAGLIPLGGGDSPLTTDFSTFSPFGTAAQLANAVARPQEFSGFANPAIGSLGQLAYGLNQYGSPSKRPYLDALLALAASTPEQQAAEAWLNQGSDQSNRMFPNKTLGSTLLRYLIGPAMPRHVNKGALTKAAAREKSGQR